MSHGGAVLMGHKTLLIIGHPLADRQNFVLSRDPSLKIEGVVVVNDLPIFLASLQTDIWIIGGAEIYAQTLSYVDELYITRIDAAFDCDQFYPELGDGLVETWRSGTQQENGLEFTQFIYKRQA